MDEQSPTPLDLRSHDLAADKREDLLRLFPEVRTESGQIDFERLKLALGEMVDTGRERYGLTWPGKADCFRAIQTPSMGTLRPAPEESINFDTTENLIIEGDNLEVLKLLQKSYLGKVKMIYIDPPYNTGNDFIYPDNFSESLETYLQYTGQVDAEGKKFSTNTDTDGRFHSRWLNMMYPRLYLARNLLREDGVILISIDDAEQQNLRNICDDIFGEENFIAQLVWEKGRKNDAKLVSIGHEYMIVYARNKPLLSEAGVVWREAKPGADSIQVEYLRLRAIHGTDDPQVERGLAEFFATLPRSHPAKRLSRYSNVDHLGVWRDDNMSWPGGGGPTYDVIHPTTGLPCAVPEGGWRYSTPERMQEMITAGRVLFREDHTSPPIRKTYLVRSADDSPEDDGDDVGIQVAGSYFYRSGLQATNTLRALFGQRVFDNPKDHEVIARWIAYAGGSDHNGVYLDFFAGSGTTAHAVLDLNKQDGGNRKFILVQLPEPTDREDYPTIAEITKERVRRVINGLDAEDEGKLGLTSGSKPDRGFRAYKLAESNFTTWDAQVATPAELAGQLTAHVDHLRAGRTDQDLLAEIILKAGLPLTAPVETLEVAGIPVHRVDGSLLVCLSRALTLDAVRAMATMAPARVVCLDTGFQDNDQLKANAVQLFKAKNIVFRTA